MPDVVIKIHGLAEIERRLAGLPLTIQRKLLKSAVTRSTRPIVRSAYTRARRRTGFLRKHITALVKTYRAGSVVYAAVGVLSRRIRIGVYKRGRNKGRPIMINPAKYAHLLERGTRHARAYPFLRPAYEEHRARTLELFAKYISAGLDREYRKAAR